MGDSIRVDIAGLDGLVRTLSAIRDQIGTLGQDIGAYDDAIGAPKVKQKLSEVAGNWSQARRRVSDEIGRLASMAETAAATYRAKEQDISNAVEASSNAGTIPGG